MIKFSLVNISQLIFDFDLDLIKKKYLLGSFQILLGIIILYILEFILNSGLTFDIIHIYVLISIITVILILKTRLSLEQFFFLKLDSYKHYNTGSVITILLFSFLSTSIILIQLSYIFGLVVISINNPVSGLIITDILQLLIESVIQMNYVLILILTFQVSMIQSIILIISFIFIYILNLKFFDFSLSHLKKKLNSTDNFYLNSIIQDYFYFIILIMMFSLFNTSPQSKKIYEFLFVVIFMIILELYFKVNSLKSDMIDLKLEKFDLLLVIGIWILTLNIIYVKSDALDMFIQFFNILINDAYIALILIFFIANSLFFISMNILLSKIRMKLKLELHLRIILLFLLISEFV